MSGEVVVTPLAFPEMAWLHGSAAAMAAGMSRAVQSELIDRGDYLDALRLAEPCRFERREIEIELPAGADARLQPARRCRHVAFLSTGDAQAAGIACVPALGIVALAGTAGLPEAVAQAIVLEHRRAGRLNDVRRQVAAGWFVRIEPASLPLDLVFHGAETLRRLQQRRNDALLDTVAAPMAPGPRAASGLADPLATLTQAVEGPYARSVLVVGAEGSGKTALVHEYVRDRLRRGASAPFETSAASLIQGLTRDGGWQHALALLCGELAERDVMLCVGHLAELFEVGQYQGNAVSLGDALREPLARGRLMLLAEATPAELSRIERRSPGFAALFQTVRLPERSEAAQERLMLDAVAALAAEHRTQVAPDAVAELIALQRRYAPYSGFPGKGIRFFESLILQRAGRDATLGRDEALAAFCAETGMPRHMLDARLPLDPGAVDRFFRSRLFGQQEALAIVVDLLATIKAGLARSGRPIASLLLIGPTGVGKTETAKALAEFMFGDARRMIRFDMSEYADPAAVLRLLGDLGQQDGVLTGAVRRQPFSVLLFDEIEKAHAGFFDLLLQVLGEGRLTGGDGLTANFCGSIVVMTSNLGAELMQRSPMGLVTAQGDTRRHFEQVVQATLRPELYNRIDHVVPFAALSAAERQPIFARELALLRRREGLLERAASLVLDDALPALLSALPGDPRYGARDAQRVLRRQVLLPLAHAIAPHAYVTPIAIGIGAAGVLPSVDCQPSREPVDAAPLQVAESMAEARRHCRRVIEGPLLVNLLNELFRLDAARRLHERRRLAQPQLPHWDGTEPAARARELAAIRQAMDGLLQEILGLEADALLGLLGEADAVPDPADWRERYAAARRRAFHAMRPGSALCTIGLYAAPEIAAMLLAAFRDLAALAGYAIKVQVVRMDDEKKPTPPRAAHPPADPPDIPADPPAPAEPPPNRYAVFPWPQTGGSQALIVGYEIELRGPAVFDYFRREAGRWRIVERDAKSDAWVVVRNGALEDVETPPGVHRQRFFDVHKEHRRLQDRQLADPLDDWSCGFPFAQPWKRLLDRRFEALMDDMLLGEDDA